MNVARVPVPARRLLTLGEGHEVWSDPGVVAGGVAWKGPDGFEVGGAVIRLHPPPGATEEQVAAVTAAVERAGAVRVKVSRRTQVPEVLRRSGAAPSAPRQTHREAVMRAVVEARSSDPEALRALVGGILDEEGL